MTHTRYLPEEQKKRLHSDFIANEQQYWHMRDQLLPRYSGKWVAVHQGQVVTVRQDILDITDHVGKLCPNPAQCDRIASFARFRNFCKKRERIYNCDRRRQVT